MVSSNHELYRTILADPAELDRCLASVSPPSSGEILYHYLERFPVLAHHDLLDIGSRDARYALEIARRFGCRVAAVDPLQFHAELAAAGVAGAELAGRVALATAGIEALPFVDGAFDHIWCRDMLLHTDLTKGLPECLRVLGPGGRMLVLQTFATDRLEPREAERLYAALHINPESMSTERFERIAGQAGFRIADRREVGSEWYEHRLEAGDRTMIDHLLEIARLRRARSALEPRYGDERLETACALRTWGIYQMLGKLNSRIYVLARPEEA